MENLLYDLSSPKGSNVVELFAVKTDQVEAIIGKEAAIRGAIMTICELTAVLLERGVFTSADSKA